MQPLPSADALAREMSRRLNEDFDALDTAAQVERLSTAQLALDAQAVLAPPPVPEVPLRLHSLGFDPRALNRAEAEQVQGMGLDPVEFIALSLVPDQAQMIPAPGAPYPVLVFSVLMAPNRIKLPTSRVLTPTGPSLPPHFIPGVTPTIRLVVHRTAAPEEANATPPGD